MRVLALPIVWIVGLFAVLWTARWPNPYSVHVARIPLPHPYPLNDVLSTAFLMTLQVGVQILILRPRTYSRSWGRSLVAAAVTLPFLAYAALLAMHSPPYWFFYFWWMVLVAVALLMLSAISGLAKLKHGHAT
jgi:hypothetical protein